MNKKVISEESITKKFLLDALKGQAEGIREEMKFALDTLELKIDEKSQKYNDQVLTKLDGIMGEIEKMREDRILGGHQTSELSQQVNDHEIKIGRLEKRQQAA